MSRYLLLKQGDDLVLWMKLPLLFVVPHSKPASPFTSRRIIYCDCSDQIRSHLKLSDYFSRQLLPHTLECDFYITYPLYPVTTQQLNEMQDIAQQSAFPRNSKYSINIVKGHSFPMQQLVIFFL